MAWEKPQVSGQTMSWGGKKYVFDPNTGQFQDAPNPNDPMQQAGWARNALGDYAGKIEGLANPFAGINTSADAAKMFGLRTNVDSLYNPVRQRLGQMFAGRRGKALSSAATRMGSGTAIPEATFAGLEGELANAENEALAGVETEAARGQLSQESQIADTMMRALGFGMNFDLSKLTGAAGLKSQQSQLASSDASLREQLGGPDFMDYLGMFLGAAGKAGGAALGKPVTNNYYS